MIAVFQSNEVLTKLAKLKELHDPEPRSSSKGAPLITYLTLYAKSRRASYINYMEGAKALYFWLAPLEIILPKVYSYPDLLRSYESKELAKIIAPDVEDNIAKAEDAIILTLTQEVETCAIIHCPNP